MLRLLTKTDARTEAKPKQKPKQKPKFRGNPYVNVIWIGSPPSLTYPIKSISNFLHLPLSNCKYTRVWLTNAWWKNTLKENNTQINSSTRSLQTSNSTSPLPKFIIGSYLYSSGNKTYISGVDNVKWSGGQQQPTITRIFTQPIQLYPTVVRLYNNP